MVSPMALKWGHLLGLIVMVFAAAVPVLAQDSPESPTIGLASELTGSPEGSRLTGAELDRVTEEVTALMRCPVCQGLSVADSSTASAIAMKQEARELLAAGFSGDQVLAYFERSYGEFIRLSPKPEGFNLVVWLLPVAALLLGALVVAMQVQRRGRGAMAVGGKGEGAQVPEDLASYVERVQREVPK